MSALEITVLTGMPMVRFIMCWLRWDVEGSEPIPLARLVERKP